MIARPSITTSPIASGKLEPGVGDEGEGDDRVQAQARGDRIGHVRVEAHDDRHHPGDEARRGQDGVEGKAGAFEAFDAREPEDRRVHEDDVGHDDEGRQACDRVPARRRSVLAGTGTVGRTPSVRTRRRARSSRCSFPQERAGDDPKTASGRRFPHRERRRRQSSRRDAARRTRRASSPSPGWRRPGSRSRWTGVGTWSVGSGGRRPSCPRSGRARIWTRCRRVGASTALWEWPPGSRRCRRSGDRNGRWGWSSSATRRRVATGVAGASGMARFPGRSSSSTSSRARGWSGRELRSGW